VRRDPRHTIYATAVGDVIKRLAGEFIPNGIGLTAPVCEVTDPRYNDVLDEEIELDLLQGLFGKTAIHPDQIELIEAHFKVNPEDYDEAVKIVDPAAPAVFKPGSRMCEPTTHTYWAQDIIARAEAYGVKGR
jgi:citrate lyase beta subunit